MSKLRHKLKVLKECTAELSSLRAVFVSRQVSVLPLLKFPKLPQHSGVSGQPFPGCEETESLGHGREFQSSAALMWAPAPKLIYAHLIVCVTKGGRRDLVPFLPREDNAHVELFLLILSLLPITSLNTRHCVKERPSASLVLTLGVTSCVIVDRSIGLVPFFFLNCPVLLAQCAAWWLPCKLPSTGDVFL